MLCPRVQSRAFSALRAPGKQTSKNAKHHKLDKQANKHTSEQETHHKQTNKKQTTLWALQSNKRITCKQANTSTTNNRPQTNVASTYVCMCMYVYIYIYIYIHVIYTYQTTLRALRSQPLRAAEHQLRREVRAPSRSRTRKQLPIISITIIGYTNLRCMPLSLLLILYL